MSDYERLVQQLSRLATEQVNPDTADIDRLPAAEVVRRINNEDKKVAAVVESALGPIAKAAEEFTATLKAGHRVFYVGAGTSGRLGVLDAAECPPTFGTDPTQITGVISGGYATVVLSMEGVEDNQEAARFDLMNHKLTRDDFVIGIAASKRTPYTLAALAYAKELGCTTAFIICNDPDELAVNPDIIIALPVGPEVITGSTRMKSGTAQKMALNMISTTAMVLLGKTCGNLMIDLQAKSEKLAARSRKILMDLFSLSTDEASDLLIEAGGSVKVALVMKRHQCTAEQARQKLRDADGFIHRIG
jgi:N-acetylmuramic acid 6-phosphate etherase